MEVTVMTRLFPNAEAERWIFWSGYDALGSWLLVLQRSFDQHIVKHRDEAIIRSLDRRLLEDAGIEPMPNLEITPQNASRRHFLPLSEPFSWTRFGK
jgi:hypothetical protein